MSQIKILKNMLVVGVSISIYCVIVGFIIRDIFLVTRGTFFMLILILFFIGIEIGDNDGY